MLDSSHKNVLFQAEFNTDLQLADVMKFVVDRFTLAELLTAGDFTARQLVDAVAELNDQAAVAEEMFQRRYVSEL